MTPSPAHPFHQQPRSRPAGAAHAWRRAGVAAWVVASLGLAGTAQAALVKSFTWVIEGYTATGTLTVEDTPVYDTFRRITGLTGLMNGQAMSLVPADLFPGSAPADNLIDIDAAEITYNGLSWQAGGKWWNMYRDPGEFVACSGEINDPFGCWNFYNVSTFALGDAPTAVSAPATVPLLAISALALLATGRRRRRD